MRYHAPLDPDCPQVAKFMDGLFNDPMTEAYGAPTDEYLRRLRTQAPRDVQTLSRVRRSKHRGAVMINWSKIHRDFDATKDEILARVAAEKASAALLAMLVEHHTLGLPT
jgi:hypothetical protein